MPGAPDGFGDVIDLVGLVLCLAILALALGGIPTHRSSDYQARTALREYAGSVPGTA
ncbi:hypothetical protein CC2G_002127 [Coprinopsis cinerea AmutBmut pab1-1]|nr:hypothetical protein CC2G_002127 [Coprinopsis cinerea AmutBmut pab1-1]